MKTDESGGSFSGRKIGVDAGMCETAIRIRKGLGN